MNKEDFDQTKKCLFPCKELDFVKYISKVTESQGKSWSDARNSLP